jgi:hypothetical protein
VRLLTRRGCDWTQRFRLVADAAAGLRRQSCLNDDEAVVCGERGLPDFKLLVRDRRDGSAQSRPGLLTSHPIDARIERPTPKTQKRPGRLISAKIFTVQKSNIRICYAVCHSFEGRRNPIPSCKPPILKTTRG